MTGRISDDDVNKVREATDLVALVAERTQVKPKGREFWCCCPLHQEKTPSFKIDPAAQLWHCFGCGEGGDAFGFIMKADDLSFPEAVRKLADRAHIEIAEGEWTGATASKRNRLKEACRETADFYHLQLMRGRDEGAASARNYLSKRGLGGDIPKKWQLGYAPGQEALVAHLASKGYSPNEMIEANVAVSGKHGRLRDRFFGRAMFPIADAAGSIIAFGGRVLGEGNPKYLNSQETSIFHKAQVLYGLDRAKSQMTVTGTAIVTEGYTDVIAMHEAGLTNTVATLGTSLTRSHIRQLARHAGKRIVYIFDGDAAGQRATERALQFIDESITPEAGVKRIEVCALCLPDGQDPAEYLDSHSPEDMQALIRGALPLVMFGIERRLARHDCGTAEGRAAALSDALDVLAPIKDSILAKDYAAQVAGRLRFREDDVLDQLRSLKKPKRYDAEDFQRKSDAASDGSVRGGSAQGSGGALSSSPSTAKPQTVRLSIAERNRLALEREFLGMIAQHPLEFLQHADALQNIRWHDSAHLEIAQSILSTLMQKLDSSPAEIVDAAAQAVAKAPSILTATSAKVDSDPGVVITFLAEELEMGDIEDELAELKALSLRSRGAEESTEEGYAKAVALQERLMRMKKAHKPLS